MVVKMRKELYSLDIILSRIKTTLINVFLNLTPDLYILFLQLTSIKHLDKSNQERQTASRRSDKFVCSNHR
jgi:hypothetical protein